jgi:FG-GAP-like repeat
MTYASQNSGNISLSGTSTLLQSLLGDHVLPHQLYGEIQDALTCLTTNVSACTDSLTLHPIGGQSDAATGDIADYSIKVALTASGILNAYVDFNADCDFGDAGEAVIVGLDLAALYGADHWQVITGQLVMPHYDSHSSLTPGAKPEPTGSGTSLTPGAKPEPGSGTPPPPFEVPGNGGTPPNPNPRPVGNVPPIFIVPATPSIIAGVTGAVVGAIEVIDPDTTGYTFTVLDGTQSVGGTRVVDNRFIVQNGELRLNPGVSIAVGSSNALNLVIEVVDADGNAFRSSNLNVFVNNGIVQVGGGGAGNTVIYTEGVAPIDLAAGLTLVGGAGGPTQIDGASVRIGDNYVAGQDFLRVGAGAATSGTLNGLAWNFNAATGVLSFTGAAPVATYQEALRQVTYFNASQNPSTLGRTINFLIGGGAAPIGQANLVVDIVAVDNPGTFQFPAAPSLTAGVAGAAVGQIIVNDPDSFYTISIGGGFDQQFQIINGGPNGGQLGLKPGQSIATAGSITIPVIATDNATGATLTQDLIINVGTGAAPGAYTIGGLTAAGGLPTLSYTEQQPPVLISAGITIGGGPAGAALTGASVAITGFNAAQQERLGIAGQAGNSGTIAGTTLTWTDDPATGILTFAGAGSAADYQTAFRQVVYSNNSDAPLASRSIAYSVGSGANAGQGVATIGITAVNDLPTAINLSSNRVPTAQPGGVIGAISVVDPDGPGGNYRFTVTGGDGLFELVNGQLKLKSGQAVGAGQIISSITIDLIDAGAPNGGAFSQTFNLTTGVGAPSEIFWRNSGTTQLVFWDVINARELVSGRLLTYGQGIGDNRVGQEVRLDNNWRLVGLRDLNADGINDVVVTNGTNISVNTIGEVNGRPVTVEAQRSPVFASTVFGALNGQTANPLSTWQLIGIEDMNADNQPDYVFYSTELNGIVIWTTNANNQITNGFRVASTPTIPGTFEAIGDFDGDGDKDILWRNGSNVTLWTMNGGQFVSQTALTQLAPPAFVMSGVGDFNNDGRQDVVWRNQATNTTVLWLFSANTAQNPNPPAVTLPAAGSSSWQIGAVADLDGDGTSDLLWRNNTEDLAVYWRISNGQFDRTKSGAILNRLPNGTGGPIATLDPAWNIRGANAAPQTPVAPTP